MQVTQVMGNYNQRKIRSKFSRKQNQAKRKKRHYLIRWRNCGSSKYIKCNKFDFINLSNFGIAVCYKFGMKCALGGESERARKERPIWATIKFILLPPKRSRAFGGGWKRVEKFRWNIYASCLMQQQPSFLIMTAFFRPVCPKLFPQRFITYFPLR